MNPIFIGNRRVGNGAETYIALEIGATHTGIESALKLLKATVAAKADALKVQILDHDRLMGRDVDFAWGTKAELGGDPRKESLHAILGRRWMPAEDWIALGNACAEAGVDLIATIDFPSTLAIALKAGAASLKLCSGDVNNLAWIGEVARAGLPIMLDTGLATLGEIEQAVEAAYAVGNDRVVVHHCPSGYPAGPDGVNLRVLTTLQQMFGDDIVVAFSDHSPGHDMDVAAVALGASMVEKTLTLRRGQHGPEHEYSLEPDEATAFVTAMRATQAALGRPRRIVGEAERRGKYVARRSAFLARDLRIGQVITETAIEWRRPGDGFAPAEVAYLVGRVVRHDLPAGHQLEWRDI